MVVRSKEGSGINQIRDKGGEALRPQPSTGELPEVGAAQITRFRPSPRNFLDLFPLFKSSLLPSLHLSLLLYIPKARVKYTKL